MHDMQFSRSQGGKSIFMQFLRSNRDMMIVESNHCAKQSLCLVMAYKC